MLIPTLILALQIITGDPCGIEYLNSKHTPQQMDCMYGKADKDGIRCWKTPKVGIWCIDKDQREYKATPEQVKKHAREQSDSRHHNGRAK